MNHFHRSAAYKNAHYAAAPLGRRVLPVLFCFLAALFLSAAAVSAGTIKISRESFPKKKSAYTGTSGSFTVTVAGAKASRLRWKTGNAGVVKLKNTRGATCRVKFVKPGTTTVTCYVKGKKKPALKCRVTVRKCKTKLKKLTFPEALISLYPGDACKNPPAVVPKNANLKKQLVYSSSNEAVAAVNGTGLVTAKKAGTAYIKAKAVDGSGIVKKYKVRVCAISMPVSTAKIFIGETYACALEGTADSAAASGIRWYSSDPEIASVDEHGTVTGHQPGKAVITAQVDNAEGQSVSFTADVHFKILKDSTRFIAHRGYSSIAPENTLKAYILAGEAGFWGAETDVRKTADGHYILLHDASFSRMCGDVRKPEDMTLEEIKALKIISGNGIDALKDDADATTVATLDEYLTVCIQYGMVPVIELKGSFSGNEEDALQLFTLVSGLMGSRPYYFISFDSKWLTAIKEILPESSSGQVTFQYLGNNLTTNMKAICTEYGFDYSLDFKYISLPVLNELRAGGAKVGLWTVNRKASVENLLFNGVDYITTDKAFWLPS